jgi:hypothetical protein
MKSRVKRTVPRDFRLKIFLHESVFPKPLSVPIGPFQICLQIPEDICISRCTTVVVDISVKWTKSSIMKVLNSFFGYRWVVELT